jgi:hypothetical protein
MRSRWKTARAVTIWAVATGAGIGVSWLGVRPVLDAAVPDRLVAFPVAAPNTPTPAGRPTRPDVTPGRSVAPTATPSPTPAPIGSSASRPTVVDGWTVLDHGQYLRTFRLVGGNATVQAGGGKLELVSAIPNPGYVMTVNPPAGDRIVVGFTGPLHWSTLDARWEADRPTAEVTEFP